MIFPLLGCLGPGEILLLYFGMFVLPAVGVLAVVGSVVCAVTGRGKERRIQRQLRGLCATCGYNLCASPVRCPECGTPVPRVTIRCSAETAALLPEGARRWCESATRHT
jgi:hypothetical protein